MGCIVGFMFERFSPRARRVIVAAQEQARELGHSYIGTEHILLGVLTASVSHSVAPGPRSRPSSVRATSR